MERGRKRPLPRSDPRGVTLEYPGYVKDESQVIDTLGGQETITTAHASKKANLSVWFRPTDAVSHPINLERCNREQLLLRVSTTKNKCPTFDIVASLSQTYVPKGMADFQYLSPALVDESLRPADIMARDQDPRLQMDLPPSVFSLVSVIEWCISPFLSIFLLNNCARQPHPLLRWMCHATSISDFDTVDQMLCRVRMGLRALGRPPAQNHEIMCSALQSAYQCT